MYVASGGFSAAAIPARLGGFRVAIEAKLNLFLNMFQSVRAFERCRPSKKSLVTMLDEDDVLGPWSQLPCVHCASWPANGLVVCPSSDKLLGQPRY